jgi:hypothetical protein
MPGTQGCRWCSRTIVLPKREYKPDYARTPVAPELYVPAVY